uniref:Ubiquitin-like protease family profile domain-containing protein n=1 Tax=Brassica campestris TaxID=3711 RepID=A0A3P5YIW3_BRACM|nr:unnamed protein product [Brassica rapa]
MNPIALRIVHTAFNLTVAQRLICAGKWLGDEEMDAMIYIWRENTSLRRWSINRVAFMSAMFCYQIETSYRKFVVNKRAYKLPNLLLAYGREELPAHGRTDKVPGVDVDRLYFPLFVNGNHWIFVCVNIIEKKVEIFNCLQRKNRKFIEKFAARIIRIVKAAGPPENKKKLLHS